jgi:hypothetical protein
MCDSTEFHDNWPIYSKSGRTHTHIHTQTHTHTLFLSLPPSITVDWLVQVRISSLRLIFRFFLSHSSTLIHATTGLSTFQSIILRHPEDRRCLTYAVGRTLLNNPRISDSFLSKIRLCTGNVINQRLWAVPSQKPLCPVAWGHSKCTCSRVGRHDGGGGEGCCMYPNNMASQYVLWLSVPHYTQLFARWHG